MKENHVFAVRIGLEIGEGEAPSRLAVEAVSSHMRILTGVVGPLVVTTSPSEPMLAIAAARALNSSSKTYQKAIETLLDKLILRGLILDRGLQGELYSRLLLMLARDKAAVCAGYSFVIPDSISREPTVRPVQLSNFLQTLLGPDLGISDGIPDQVTLCTNLLQATSNVWINFTHFVQLSGTIDEIMESALLEAWSSGFAFQCAFNQGVIDGFFVACAGMLHEPFDIHKLIIIP
jgi:hypothetical protein